MQKIIFKCLLPHSPIQPIVLWQSYITNLVFCLLSFMLSQIIDMLLDDVLKSRYLVEKGNQVEI